MSHPPGPNPMGLSAAKRALVEAMLRSKGLAAAREAIPRRDPGPAAPLSFAQQRLWVLDQMGSGPAYNVAEALRVSGPLERTALERSLRHVVGRHEALRTRFVAEGAGEPVQVIAPEVDLTLASVDLTHLPEREREQVARQRAEQEARIPFDLARGPLVRATLLRLADADHVLLLTLHHIVSDGWSALILVRELTVLYRSFAAGLPPSLPELPIQYADFATWQRRWLRGAILERQLSYWRGRLAGAATLALPSDRPRPALRSFRGASTARTMAGGLAERLRALSQREGVTPFMTLMAAFQALLHRYSGQDDIVVGSPIANRNRTELEGLIGFFVNSLALRGDLSGDPTFRELLGRVKEAALGAYAHQDVPFEKLVEELHPPRRLGQNPIFQVTFDLQKLSSATMGLEGLTLRPLERTVSTTRFDLELRVWEGPDRLVAGASYSTDLFEADTVASMLGHYQTLLEAVAARPDARLSELTLLGDEERDRLLRWAGRSSVYPRQGGIPGQFEIQAARRPDAVAVSFGGEKLGYEALNRRANQLARYLGRLGVSRGDRVGICIDRSPEMVVGLLGILKSGGAYVPLDPAYPEERLAFMLRDSGVPLVLTQERLAAGLAGRGTRTVCLDRDWPAISAEREENLAIRVGGEDLAYVTYTSGSTGVPKGVEVPHRGVLRLVMGTDYVELGPGETLLQLAPVTFDASTLEVWGALLPGGRCVLYPKRVATPGDLEEVIGREGVSTLWLTASLYNAVVDESPGALRGVKQLLIGGEALSVPHVRRGLEALAGTQIINGYGPTEGTTFTCCHPIPRVLEDGGSSIPIGRPITNTRVYVLDRRMNLVPAGMPGELFVGGDGVARGYLKRPALTAASFVPDPFAAAAGQRLYRTGDLVRWRRDGVIEFLGRVDTQVKVRGFRIELGEIEAVLGEHPGVQKSVVAVREDVPGDKRIVAYVVAAPDAAPATAELRQHLQAKLPEYMVPSAFMVLEALPLDPNGKVDRRALPAPDGGDASAAAYAPPTNELERLLAGIWQDVLGRASVGIHDNFFDLGGHSLLLIQVHRRTREARPDCDLPVMALFEHPTIAALAVHMRAISAVRGTRREEDEAPAGEVEDLGEGLRAGRRRLGRRRESLQRAGEQDGTDA